VTLPTHDIPDGEFLSGVGRSIRAMTPRSSDTDACPGALRLHTAADGMLARVRLPGGMLSGAQLRSLRDLAEEFGDGCLELTSRANLQLRALKPGDAPALAARLRSAGLLPSSTHDNVRNIASPPLPGSPLRALVGRLDLAIQADAALAALPGKFLFAIGQVPLAADVAAIPTAPPPAPGAPRPAAPGAVPGPAVHGDGSGPPVSVPVPVPVPGAVRQPPGGDPGGGLFAIRLAGHDTGLRAGFDDVVPVLIAAAHAFLGEREAQRLGGAAAWRLRELIDGPARVSARVAAALGLTPAPVEVAAPVDASSPADLIGVVPQDDGLAAVAALVPLGRLDGVPLRALEDAELLIVTPWRGVVVADLPPEAARAWADRLAAAGLAVTPGSPWSGVTACAGRPGCAKSLADVRADATAAARFVDGLPVHWVGCARACGSPAGPHVRAEATTGGYLITRRPAGGDDEPAVRVRAPVRARSAATGRPSAGDSGLIGPSTTTARPPMIGVSTPFAEPEAAAASCPGDPEAERQPGDPTAERQPGDPEAERQPGDPEARQPEDAAAAASRSECAASGLEDAVAVARRP
jgi:precorrin-3B synthase